MRKTFSPSSPLGNVYHTALLKVLFIQKCSRIFFKNYEIYQNNHMLLPGLPRCPLFIFLSLSRLLCYSCFLSFVLATCITAEFCCL